MMADPIYIAPDDDSAGEWIRGPAVLPSRKQRLKILLLCWIGFHRWVNGGLYRLDTTGELSGSRQCSRCGKVIIGDE